MGSGMQRRPGKDRGHLMAGGPAAAYVRGGAMRRLGLIVAIVVATVDILYIWYVGFVQGGTSDLPWRVPFVAAYLGALAICAIRPLEAIDVKSTIGPAKIQKRGGSTTPSGFEGANTTSALEIHLDAAHRRGSQRRSGWLVLRGASYGRAGRYLNRRHDGLAGLIEHMVAIIVDQDVNWASIWCQHRIAISIDEILAQRDALLHRLALRVMEDGRSPGPSSAGVVAARRHRKVWLRRTRNPSFSSGWRLGRRRSLWNVSRLLRHRDNALPQRIGAETRLSQAGGESALAPFVDQRQEDVLAGGLFIPELEGSEGGTLEYQLGGRGMVTHP